MKIPFDNSYIDLPAQLYVATAPTPVPAPALICYNQALADELGIQDQPDIAVFAGAIGLVLFTSGEPDSDKGKNAS